MFGMDGEVDGMNHRQYMNAKMENSGGVDFPHYVYAVTCFAKPVTCVEIVGKFGYSSNVYRRFYDDAEIGPKLRGYGAIGLLNLEFAPFAFEETALCAEKFLLKLARPYRIKGSVDYHRCGRAERDEFFHVGFGAVRLLGHFEGKIFDFIDDLQAKDRKRVIRLLARGFLSGVYCSAMNEREGFEFGDGEWDWLTEEAIREIASSAIGIRRNKPRVR